MALESDSYLTTLDRNKMISNISYLDSTRECGGPLVHHDIA